MILKTSTLLLFFATVSYGANILAILPMPSYSHQIAYTHIWKELSLRGHKVTLITTDPINDPKLTNLTEIDMKWTYKLLRDVSNIAQNEIKMWNVHLSGNMLISYVCEAELSHPEVRNLIFNKTHFDVVLVEFLFPEFLAFAEIYNCPKILLCSLDSTVLIHNALGNPTSPVVYPEIGATFYGPLSFLERIESTLFTWYSLYIFSNNIFPERTKFVRKHFNVTKTVHELVSDVDLMFINVNPILQPIRALGPSTITIGGNRPEAKSAPLPQDIAEFLDSATNGFIYFSLGSNVKSKNLDQESMESIIGAFKELPYKVLWKFEADEFANKPENVKLIKWAPQQTVLSHRNIKLFVTQGGLQSMEEALFREVPFVVIPFVGDQDYNARLMASKGIAVVVDKLPVNKGQLKAAILEVVNNPKYRNAVKRLKQLALDSPMTGLEKAVWWTEYVIRNKGARHLRNPAADIPFYQYFLIDVIGFLILSFTAAVILTYLVIRIIFRYIRLHIFRCTNRLTSKRSKME